MKFFFTIITLVFTVFFPAQNVGHAFTPNGRILYFNHIKSPASDKMIDYSEIQGTPYIGSDYRKAKIGNFGGSINATYNTYTDEIEYFLNDKVNFLPRDKDFSPIKFLDSNEEIIYISDDKQQGYYYVLSNGTVKLLRKNSTIFVDEQPAKTSYSNTQPAKFQNLKAAYFLYKDSKLNPIKKESDLIEFYPDKNLKTIMKENKIKFDKEKDLIRLVQLFN